MNVPVSWRESITRYEQKLFYNVTYWPRTGDDFKVGLGIHSTESRERGPQTEALRRRFMEEVLRQTTLPQCEESEIISREFTGKAGYGWYTSLTYKHIRPGERRAGQYRYLTVGTYLVNGDLLNFMIQSHEKDVQVINQTLEMLKSARRVTH